MGIKQIPTEDFLAYLAHLGLLFTRKTRHYVYDYPDGHARGKLPRPLTIRTNKKDMPLMHIHSNFRTLDPINGKKDFEIWYAQYKGSGSRKNR